jgi:hypothetical protein
MKLRRGFLNIKRLLLIAINYNMRVQWLIDYVKSIGVAMQNLNSQEVLFEYEVKDYVLYNGQTLSLENYADDQVDIIERRSYIESIAFPSYAFYGYLDENDEWVYEVDSNPTTLYGYTSDAGPNYVFERENDPEDDNSPLYGYIGYIYGGKLRDVSGDPIISMYDEFIYTLESYFLETDYIWFKEAQAGDRLTIWVHNDMFNELSSVEIEELREKLKRYITAPYSDAFSIKGYN